jgi:hypothetical protein
MKRIKIWSLVGAVIALGCGVQTEESPLEPGTSHEHGDAGAEAGAHGERIVDAPDAAAWVHLAFESGLGVLPASDAGWDLRVARTMLGTNSGTSGAGQGGALETDFAELNDGFQCPREGYVVDAMLPGAGPPGSSEFSGNPVLNQWYNYDGATHAVTTKGRIYCVRTARGDYGAIRIRNYASGQMTIEWHYTR